MKRFDCRAFFAFAVCLMPLLTPAAQRVEVLVKRSSTRISSYTAPLKFAVDEDGNTFFTGVGHDLSNAAPSGDIDWDFLVSKYNKRFRRTEETYLYPFRPDEIHRNKLGNNLVFDRAGNLYVTGIAQPDRNRLNVVTYKFADGALGSQSIVWTNFFKGMESDGTFVPGMAVDANGNVALIVRGHLREVLVKINATGETEWTKEFAFPNTATLEDDYRVTFDSQGHVIIGGPGASVERPPHVLKYRSAGDLLWSNAITDGLLTSHVSLAVGSNDQIFAGSVIMQLVTLPAPSTNWPAPGPWPWPSGPITLTRYSCVLRSFDANGAPLWTNHNTMLKTRVPIMATDSQGSLYVAGTDENVGATNKAIIAKFSSQGKRVWGRETDLPPRPIAEVRFGRVEPKLITLFADTFARSEGEHALWQRVQIVYRQR
jgi:hypothetical protein